jgi:hypothetical protein
MWSKMYIGLRVKYRLLLSDFHETWNFLDTFSEGKEASSTKFHENPSNGSRVVPCGRTERDVTKLTVAFRDFANAPKKDVFGMLGCAYSRCVGGATKRVFVELQRVFPLSAPVLKLIWKMSSWGIVQWFKEYEKEAIIVGRHPAELETTPY